MSRRAVVMGSNGPPQGALQYALRDAAGLAQVLAWPLYDYDVTLVLHPEAPDSRPLDAPGNLHRVAAASSRDASKILFDVADQCNPDDEIIVFFSGHGVVRLNELVLLWESTDVNNLLSTGLWGSDMLRALRHCRSQRRTLILDSCHAGAAASMLHIKEGAVDGSIQEVFSTGESFQIIFAADKLEKAREFKRYRGSFLTSAIVRGLERHAASWPISGELTVQDLVGQVEAEAVAHNRQSPTDLVPIPYVMGESRLPVRLTRPDPLVASDRLEWPDGTWMRPVLPSPIEGYCVGMGEAAVTNGQYTRFLRACPRHRPPEWDVLTHSMAGRSHWRVFRRLGLTGDLAAAIPTQPPAPATPKGLLLQRDESGGAAEKAEFEPLSDTRFNADDQPVVCVSMLDAFRYADWVRTLSVRSRFSMLPMVGLYRACARPAVGTGSPVAGSDRPLSSDRPNAHTSWCGIRDLYGNVWEWALDWEDQNRAGIGLLSSYEYGASATIFGGGAYLDPAIHLDRRDVLSITDFRGERGIETRHSDLGFRLAALVPLADLSPLAREHLAEWGRREWRSRSVGPRWLRHDSVSAEVFSAIEGAHPFLMGALGPGESTRGK